MSDAGLIFDTATRVGGKEETVAVFTRALISASDSRSSCVRSSVAVADSDDIEVIERSFLRFRNGGEEKETPER